MRGKVAPNDCADEDQQGGRQGQGEGKHHVGHREREKNEDSIRGNGLPGKEQALCASELKKEPGDQPGEEQCYRRAAGCVELPEAVIGQQHVQDVEMDHGAGNRLSRGQERDSSSDRVWKKHDDLVFEPLGEPIAFVMLYGAPDRRHRNRWKSIEGSIADIVD